MVTRKDIAKIVGVSVSVVSRALNNSGYVSKEKRKEIIRVANELGYRPNPVAMSLQQRRTKQILFYCKDLNNPFNIEMYEGMIEEAEKNGYVVVINGKINFDIIPDLMIDGIVLPSQQVTKKYLEKVGRKYYLPVVTASYGDNVYFPKAVPMVETDLYEGTIKALQYLRNRGHRKIAMATPYYIDKDDSRSLAWKEFMKDELNGDLGKYFLGISKIGLENDNRVCHFREEQSKDMLDVPESFFEKGKLAAKVFAERDLDATAVLCFNDEMAAGFSKQISEMGFDIPGDISLMGIDGSWVCKYIQPELTTLEIQKRIMGQKCVQLLLALIEGKKKKCLIRVPTRILERDSVRDLNRKIKRPDLSA